MNALEHKNAPGAARTAAEGDNQKSNHHEGEPAMTSVATKLETITDLSDVARQMGVKPSALLPDPWATSSEINEDARCVSHQHTFTQGAFSVTISHLIAPTQDAGVDALVSWSDTDEASGLGTPEGFSVQLGTIPALVNTLLRVLDVTGVAR